MELLMAYTPSFKSIVKTSNFVTNNPNGADMMSFPVRIIGFDFNENTRSFEVECDDRRMRQCRVDRMPEADAVELEKAIIKARDAGMEVRFIAAGGNNPNIFFYSIKKV
jgi:hypothetical protein